MRVSARATRVSARGSEGFTLIELMVVIIIIALVAAMAMPSMTRSSFDRRAFNDAASLGELVREARTRAIGRGAAELIQITTNQSLNSLTAQVWEAVQPNASGGGANTPLSSCGAPTVWLGSSATAVFVDQFSFASTSSNGAATAEGQGQILARMVYPYVETPVPTPVADNTPMYLCCSPSGRTLVGNSGATSFSPMVGALGVEFTRESWPLAMFQAGQNDIIRTLWIPPTGATRITSR